MTDNSIDTTIQKKLRICFVSLDIYPLFNTRSSGVQGGSEVDFYMLATELAKDKRFRVSVITGNFGQAEVEPFGDITVYRAADLQKNLLSGAMALWKALRRADADIYFKKGPALTTDLLALFCRLNHKILFFRTAHDLDCNGTYLRQYPLRSRTYMWSLKQAKRVFVQKTSDIPNLLRTTGVKAIAVPNGHRIPNSKSNGKDSVLWVGRSEDFKNPKLFIKLAKEIPSERFVMICQRTKGDMHYDELVCLAKDAPNLKFIEFVPFHEIDYYFQKAKVFVNTSDAEGFPNTFIQAGIGSTAILSLKVNPDGFLDKYRCGICCNDDWNKFVNSLKSVLSEDRYIEFGNNARNYMENTHDIRQIIEQYKKHFLGVLKEKKT